MPVKVGGLPTIGELHAEGQELLGQWLAFRQAVPEQGDELLLLAEGDIAQPQVQREGKPRWVGAYASDGDDRLVSPRDDYLHRHDPGSRLPDGPAHADGLTITARAMSPSGAAGSSKRLMAGYYPGYARGYVRVRPAPVPPCRRRPRTAACGDRPQDRA
jgi:hypothetical protein